MIKEHKYFLTWLFIISFVIRVGLFLAFIRHDQNAWIYFDSDQYHQAAVSLVEGKGFFTPSGEPNFYRLPGYPVFLALSYKLFNTQGPDALWLQIVLASLIPVLIFLLSLVLFPQQIFLARLAGLISAFHLGFVLYAGMLATESLCLFFLLLFFLLFFLKKNNGFLFLAGIFLGLASLIRPIGHYLLVIALAMFVLSHQKIRASLALSTGWLLIVSPWLIRNFLLTGALFFHTLPGLHFLQYSAANVVMQRDNIDYVQARGRLLNEWQTLAAGKSLNEYQKCKLGEKIAFGYLKNNPFLAIKYSCVQLFKTCFGLYSAQMILSDSGIWPNYNKDTSWTAKIKRFLSPEVKTKYVVFLIYLEIIMFLFLLFGLLFFLISLWWQKKNRQAFLQTIPFIGCLILITLAYGCARLRFPVEPFLIIFSLAGLLSLDQKTTL